LERHLLAKSDTASGQAEHYRQWWGGISKCHVHHASTRRY